MKCKTKQPASSLLSPALKDTRIIFCQLHPAQSSAGPESDPLPLFSLLLPGERTSVAFSSSRVYLNVWMWLSPLIVTCHSHWYWKWLQVLKATPDRWNSQGCSSDGDDSWASETYWWSLLWYEGWIFSLPFLSGCCILNVFQYSLLSVPE